MAKNRRSNGSGSVRKRGNTWQAEWYTGAWNEDGTRPIRATRGGFKTKTEARHYAEEMTALCKAQAGGKICKTLREYYNMYIASDSYAALSHDYISKYKTAWRRIAEAGIADKRVDLIDIAELDHAINDMTDAYYGRRYIKDLLSILFHYPEADRLVLLTPRGQSLPRSIDIRGQKQRQEKHTEPLTMADIEALDKEWDTGGEYADIAALALLMCYTGMMPAELRELEIEHVHMDDYTLDISIGHKSQQRQYQPVTFGHYGRELLQWLIERAEGDGRTTIQKYNEDPFLRRYKQLTLKVCGRELTPYSGRHTLNMLLDAKNYSITLRKKAMRHSLHGIQSLEAYTHVGADDIIRALDSIAPARWLAEREQTE